MAEQLVCQNLPDVYARRIHLTALLSPASVELSVRNTSGKTYTLYVVIPGLTRVQKVVVRLHRRAHKIFWQIVEQARRWLAGFKLLYAPQPLLLPAVCPGPLPAISDRNTLIAVAAKFKAETPKVAAYDWRARKAQADAIPEKRYRNRWDKARAKPGASSLNPRRKAGLA